MDEKPSRNPFRLSNPFSRDNSGGPSNPLPPASRASSRGAESPMPPPSPALAPPPSSKPEGQQQQQQSLPPPPSFEESQRLSSGAAAASAAKATAPAPPPPLMAQGPSGSSGPAPTSPAAPMAAAGPSIAPGQAGGDFRTYFACMTLNMSDIIRLISFREQDFQAVLEVVRRNWPEGVQWCRPYARSREIKCNGYPWIRSFHGEDNSRRLLLRMVQALHDRGWVLQTAIDVSKKERDKDSLFFRLQQPPPPPCEWLVISFDANNKLKIVGDTPPELCLALVQEYANLVQRYEIDGDRAKIHFVGHPWWPTGTDAVLTREMLLTMFVCLERFGFSVCSSIDMSNSQEGRECDVLICSRQRSWVPGAPIWHR